jgi:DNA-binding response OmpR family regulator
MFGGALDMTGAAASWLGGKMNMQSAADSASGPAPLTGKKILVIEDEFLIALDIERTLRRAGAADAALVSNIDDALRQIASGSWDAAVTDNNLRGHSCQEVVAALKAKRIPFLVLTGYDPQWLPGNLGEAPVITKPFAPHLLIASLHTLCVKGS